jgi:arylsulfatase A-like enzyme
VVMLDALRPDHLHFAGYRRTTSPNLDAFREESTWFRNTYTPGASTRFALASIMTGLDVESIPQNRGRTDLDLEPGTRVLGERLAERGYDPVGYTISYVTQHIRGVGAGFRLWKTPWPDDEWEKNFPVSATKTTDAGLEYLASVPATDERGHDGKPFFLFLHYRCTHQPYARNERWIYGDSSLDDYDSGLSYCDDELGRLFAALRARPDADRTATFVFSDHGELFDEHGLSEHGSSIFQPDVRTVLLAHVPFLKRVPEVDTPVSLLDLEATWLSLAGTSNPDSRGWDLLPLLAHGDQAGDRQRPLFLYTDMTRGTVRHQVRGVLLDRLKYVRDLSTGTTALYDVITDPKESTDVSASSPRERARRAERQGSWERGTARR